MRHRTMTVLVLLLALVVAACGDEGGTATTAGGADTTTGDTGAATTAAAGDATTMAPEETAELRARVANLERERRLAEALLQVDSLDLRSVLDRVCRLTVELMPCERARNAAVQFCRPTVIKACIDAARIRKSSARIVSSSHIVFRKGGCLIAPLAPSAAPC